MKKKPLTWLLACAMIVGLFAGCGKQTATQGGGSPNSAQVLTVAVASDVNTWDISQFPDGDARFVWAQIYETLVRLDEDLNLIPGLAESWEAQDKGLTRLNFWREDCGMLVWASRHT